MEGLEPGSRPSTTCATSGCRKLQSPPLATSSAFARTIAAACPRGSRCGVTRGPQDLSPRSPRELPIERLSTVSHLPNSTCSERFTEVALPAPVDRSPWRRPREWITLRSEPVGPGFPRLAQSDPPRAGPDMRRSLRASGRRRRPAVSRRSPLGWNVPRPVRITGLARKSNPPQPRLS